MADHPEKPDQRPWFLDTPHGRFAVRASTAFVQHHVVWELDGRTVADTKDGDDTMTVSPEDDVTLGKLRLTFDWLGRCRRITWLDGSDGVAGEVGLGGTDLEPPAGSYAARREARIRENPRRFAAIAVATGIGKVVVPILVALIGVRIAVHIPWPDWSIAAQTDRTPSGVPSQGSKPSSTPDQEATSASDGEVKA